MHKTAAGEKRKALKTEAMELERYARAAMKAAEILPDAREEARKLEQQADELKAESGALVGAARLEDINLWQMEKEKTTKKGSKTYIYWMASWREGGRSGMSTWGAAGRWTTRRHSRKHGR
jgi:hypothetical protein